jgi:hypothetical protein
VEAAEEEVRKYVGSQGVEEKWKDDKLVIERWVTSRVGATYFMPLVL